MWRVPQGMLSAVLQVSGAPASIAEAAYSRRLYKDAACQTPEAPRHCSPGASQSARAAQRDTATAASASLGACSPGSAAQAVAGRKLEGSTGKLRGVRRAACEPQEGQQGLLRAQSAPASLLNMHCPRASPVLLQSPSHAHRQSGQHATSQAPVPAMLHSSAASRKMKWKLRMPSSEPRTPKCSERPAWQSIFKPARRQPAARKGTTGSKPVPDQHASPPPASMSAHNADAPAHVAASSGASQVAGEGENAGACAGNATNAGNAVRAIWRVHQQDDAISSAPFLDLSESLIIP